jgi:hypothetical protein
MTVSLARNKENQGWRKVKRLISILLLCLVSLPLNIAEAAKVTPGSSCKKTGAQEVYKGRVYTCIKLGKKLYWDNGKSIKQVSATPSSSPSSSPTVGPQNWAAVRNIKIQSLGQIGNDIALSLKFNDGKLFKSSCEKLNAFINSLPSDTPKVDNLKTQLYYCVNVVRVDGIADGLKSWMYDSEVKGLPACGKPTFKYKYIDSYLSKIPGVQVIELEFTNNFAESLSLYLLRTNLSQYVFSDWVDIFEPSGPNYAKTFIRFAPNETRVIGWTVDSYKYDDLIKSGAKPQVFEARASLLDPKYGGSLYCQAVDFGPSK